MNIGLLSMQRVKNYGSFWQAYCLKKILEDNRNQVEFIDIIPGTAETRMNYKHTFSFSKIKRIPYYIFQKKKSQIFEQAQLDILGCTSKLNYRCNYDTIIIGSDEVFNFVQDSPWGFSTQLYGNINNENVNSYAACFGCTTINDIEKKNVGKEIISAFDNLKHISVRDINSAEIVKVLTGIMPDIHLDPVLIGDLPLEELPKLDLGRYILVYSYDFRFSDKLLIEKIKQLAKTENCKIYSVGFYQDWCDKNIVPTPIQLLSYFRQAQYVITDTFHGTIFSVRCHKKFVTIIRESNQQKLGDLLNRLGLHSRVVCEVDDLAGVLNKEIDYGAFEKLRQAERNRTEEYLCKCINKEQ